MKENKYDDDRFFEQYSHMDRSVKGLEGAGEWHTLKTMLPNFQGKKVLDLGCGFGWHCRYAAEHGALSALGIDLSEKMIARAEKENAFPNVEYRRMAIEDFPFPPEAFDTVISSLALHYLESFPDLCAKIYRSLTPGGTFVFSVEHPVFTAYGSQDWFYTPDGKRLHWPVDRYFLQGERQATFLGEQVTKYHKTLTTYINGLLENGFRITGLNEPEPSPEMAAHIPGMKDELRRPMMLLISAEKIQHTPCSNM
mgnify:CR=1 FL=1